jgi:hypothetical protein
LAISENWKKIVIGAVIVFALLLVLIGFFLGLQGLGQFFKFVLIGLLICSILFGIGYVIYILFIRKEFKDIPAQYRKKLHMTTKVMENDMLGDLYLSGDTKHNRIKMGKYFYLRIKLPKLYNVTADDGKTQITKTEEMPIEVFIVNRKGWINRIFSDPIFILVRPEDHDYSAIFNDVTINGFNLVPLDSQFYTIDRRNLDMDVIKGLAMNYIREVVYDIFKELDRLVHQAMALDQQFQKDKEKAREFEIPQIPQIGQQK